MLNHATVTSEAEPRVCHCSIPLVRSLRLTLVGRDDTVLHLQLVACPSSNLSSLPPSLSSQRFLKHLSDPGTD